jgi:hypothetical protein
MRRIKVALIALLLLGVFAAWRYQQSARTADKATIAAVPANPTPAERTLTPIERMKRDEAQEEALEILSQSPTPEPLFNPQPEHFLAPLQAPDGAFLQDQTRLEMDPSCAIRLHKPDGNRSAQAQLLSDYGIKGDQRVPEDVFFESLTQFFTVKEQFYQLSARARPASRPPVYTMEFYVAADAGMSISVTKLDVPVPIPANLDAISVRKVLTETLALFEKQGAQVGARLMQVRVTGAPGEADQEVSYINATPVQWAFGSGVCQLQAKRQSALCRCLPDGEVQPIPHY